MKGYFNNRRIAFLGVLTALMFVLLLVETFVFKAIMAITPAILTIPLCIAICLSDGKKSMLIGGAMFGFCSFILAICISYVIFLNPLVSIFPRLFIGLIAYGVYSLVQKIFGKSENTFIRESLGCSVAGIFGTLTNTVCTITMMWLFNAEELATVMATILSFNFLVELIGSIILVPIYVKVFKKYNYRFE